MKRLTDTDLLREAENRLQAHLALRPATAQEADARARDCDAEASRLASQGNERDAFRARLTAAVWRCVATDPIGVYMNRLEALRARVQFYRERVSAARRYSN